jgi:hypothetical protein
MGRGNDVEGIAGTKEGECAVLCPACPQPGINLPPGWQTVDSRIGYVFSVFLAVSETQFGLLDGFIHFSLVLTPTFA